MRNRHIFKFVTPSSYFLFPAFAFYELNLQVGLFHILLDFRDGRQQLRQFIDSCHRLAVVRCHDSGIGTFAKIVYADILVFVQIEESDYITVFAQLIVRFLYLLVQIGRFIAVFGSRGFGKLPSGAVTFTAR